MSTPHTEPLIRLESFSESHIPHIITACQDWKELSQYGVPFWRPRSTAELKRKVTSMQGPQPANEYNFVIVDAGNDQLVGECSLHSIDWRNRCCSIGIFIWHPEHRRRGYGRAGLCELIEWGFSYLGLERIEARIVSNNLASRRLFESLEFKPEGVSRSRLLIMGERRNTHNYALLRANQS